MRKRLKFFRRTAHYASILALFSILERAGAAQSQPPTPRTGEDKRPPPNQQTHTTERQTEDIRGTQQSPAVVRVLPIPKTPEETAHEQANSEREAATNRRIIWLTGTIALFTLGLVIVGVLQWLTYRDTLTANKDIERAYVTMSHLRPGIIINEIKITDANGIRKQEVRLNIKVQNSGNTPARITRTVLHPYIATDELPDLPIYDERFAEAGRVSLVKGDSFEIHGEFLQPSSDIEQTMSGGCTFCAIGYVDYIDKFGRRHRAGYARWYDRFVDNRHETVYFGENKQFSEALYRERNNLLFVTRANYNYDRKRNQDEGNDWSDPTE